MDQYIFLFNELLNVNKLVSVVECTGVKLYSTPLLNIYLINGSENNRVVLELEGAYYLLTSTMDITLLYNIYINKAKYIEKSFDCNNFYNLLCDVTKYIVVSCNSGGFNITRDVDGNIVGKSTNGNEDVCTDKVNECIKKYGIIVS